MSSRQLPVLCLLFFLSGLLSAQGGLRLAAWNVEALGSPSSSQWNAALGVLQRVGPEVVAIEEVQAMESGAWPLFAAQAGYPHQVLAGLSGTLTGNLKNAVLSQFPIAFSHSWSAAALSGDPGANDITRNILEAHVQLPGSTSPLGLFVLHLKAGTGDTNRFRRAVEVIRVQEAVTAFKNTFPGASWAIVGDFNEDLADGPFGDTWNSLPGGLPFTYSLGNDISFPVVYNPFVDLTALGGAIAEATQEDSTVLFTTRPISGRRLDYIVTSGQIANNGDEVYNSARDNGVDDPPLGNWLPKPGLPIPLFSSTLASDHLTVFGDFQVGGTLGFAPFVPGDVVVNEYMNNPAVVSDANGEWIELMNTSGQTLDLAGFTIRDQGGESFTLPPLTMASRGFVVLARNGNPAANGGVSADFTWPPGFLLSNGSDEIEVVSPSGLVLDSVAYDNGATFPDPNGASVERIDATVLPLGANFGVATTPFGAGDLGTPGAPNSVSSNPAFTTLSLSGSLQPGGLAVLDLDGGATLGGRSYLLGAALARSPGVLLPSNRMVDIVLDSVLFTSITPGNGFFLSFLGTLNGQGQGQAFVAIPALPSLSGLDLFLTGLVLDGGAPDGIVSIIDNAVLTVQ